MNAKEIVEKMTLEDKVAICSGEDFWKTKKFEQYDIPSFMMCDGPHGIRRQENQTDMLGINESVPATSFPTAATNACSWDVDLLHRMGEAIAKEAAAGGVAVFLGPGACLKRNPLCGRNFEYFSEDPYLAGKLAAAYICGAEKLGIGTSLKHFACNNQETKRFSSDSVIDERTLREMYLTAFEIAVKEGRPRTVMCSYNKINGTYSSDNMELLTGILRNEWGFKGLVITDWGAMHDRIRGFEAGCDLNMPGGSAYGEKAVVKAVRSGRLKEGAVDTCAKRVVELALHARKEADKKWVGYDVDTHHQLAREIAEQSIVLLKNEDEILPLSNDERIVIIGKMAEKPRYQGAGSSHIKPTKLSGLAEAMPEADYLPGCDESGETSAELLAKAAAAAKQADKVIVVAGLTDAGESEGFDRDHMRMPKGHLQMIKAVTEVNENVIVVLCCGGVIETPWADRVRGILYAGLPGQAGGEAIARILKGEVNPSGRLAETWPLTYEECPCASYYGRDYKDGQYREGIYVGYRYYEKTGQTVRWPLGHGLSYTTFSYANLQANQNKVTVQITNTGKYPGADAVLLYILPPQDGIYRPVRELKRFTKVYLKPGEETTVEFLLDDRCFAVWQDDWVVPGGTYGIQIGELCRSVVISSQANIRIPDWQKGSWYEHPKGNPTPADWEKILGRRYQEKKVQKGQFTIENSIVEMKDYSMVMKIMYKVVESIVAKGSGGKKDMDNPTFKMMMAGAAECSMSSSQINSGMRDGIMQGLVEMANGHFLRGVKMMMKGENNFKEGER